MCQLVADGCGLLIVKTELDEYPAVTQELSSEVLLPNGPKKHDAGHREQTSCGQRPRTGSWPAKVVAAYDDGMGIVGLEELNVSNEFCNIAVGLDAMNPNDLHSCRDIAC